MSLAPGTLNPLARSRHPLLIAGYMSLARANTVGLPSHPRTRSSTPGLPRQNIPSRPPSSASERPPPSSYYSSAAPPLPLQPRTIRTQRSIGSISTRPAGSLRSHSLDRSSESRHALRSESPPPLPSLPRGPRIVAAQPRGRTPAPVRVHTSSIDRPEDYGGSRRRQDVLSDSGSSSAGSDGFDGPPESASSSRTSMNEMEVDDKADKKPPAGFGSSLWGSITGVASNLTVSVSKAWSSNVASYSGEGKLYPRFLSCLCLAGAATVESHRNSSRRRVPPHTRDEGLSYRESARPTRPP